MLEKIGLGVLIVIIAAGLIGIYQGAVHQVALIVGVFPLLVHCIVKLNKKD